MASQRAELILECKRESENCLYTSTSLFIWLRWLRGLRLVFLVLPLILGSLAGWKVLNATTSEPVTILVAVCAFVAGLLPSIHAALGLDESIGECARLAGEFKNLQDRFRQVALISSKKPIDAFENDFQALMQRLEEARRGSVTPPELIFRWAQKKVKTKDYDFDVDVGETVHSS
jgi:hypothetical protein